MVLGRAFDEGGTKTTYLRINCHYTYICVAVHCVHTKLIVSEHDDDDYEIISFIYNTMYFYFYFLVFVVIFSSWETINISSSDIHIGGK